MEKENKPPKKKWGFLGGGVKRFLFYNTSTRQTVAKNTFWLSVSNIGGRLLRALIVIYAARILGATEYGVFSYAITLVAFLTIFIDIGINTILVRETARSADEHRKGQILATSFVIKLVLLVLAACVIIFVAPHLTTDLGVRSLLPIAVFILAFDTMREFGSSIIRAMEKMEVEAGLYLFTNLAIVVFGFVFLRLYPNVRTFTYAYAIGTGAGFLATLYVLRDRFKNIFRRFSSKMIGYIFVSAWPIAISSLLGILLTNTDILIIGWLRSTEDVGLYSAVLRIVQFLYVLPSLLAISITPTLVRLANRDNAKLRSILERTVGVALLAAIPMAAGGFLLASQIIAFVFGRSYLPATPSFQLLILTIIVDFSAAILVNAMYAYDGQKKLIAYSAIGGVLNVVFDLIFIPMFGITGSGLATFLAQIVSNAYLWHTMKKINNFSVMPYLKKVIAATIAMATFIILAAYLQVHVLLVIPAAALVYFALLVLLKDPLIAELKLILRPAASALPEADVSSA